MTNKRTFNVAFNPQVVEDLARLCFCVGDSVGGNRQRYRKGATISRNPLILLVGGTGLEPVTLAL